MAYVDWFARYPPLAIQIPSNISGLAGPRQIPRAASFDNLCKAKRCALAYLIDHLTNCLVIRRRGGTFEAIRDHVFGGYMGFEG